MAQPNKAVETDAFGHTHIGRRKPESLRPMNKLLSLLAFLLLVGCVANKPPEYLVSHIMCSTEADAARALIRLRKGESFEQIAADMSSDPGTRSKGGSIAHWTKADDFTSAFATEVKRLKIHEVSATPVRTEFGWHIVRVNAVR
jgi:parvulin-like peptidyl-prolyl isomerase